MLKNVDEDEKVKLAITQNVTPSHGGLCSKSQKCDKLKRG